MKYCSFCMSPMEANETECPVCGKKQETVVPGHHLLPGTILNDRYYVGSSIGEGGFGITYLGRDLNLDMEVAIKEYYPSGYVFRAGDESSAVNCVTGEERQAFFKKGKERFLKEARTLAMFSKSPGVVDVRDFFESNNTAYIVMEYLDGETLKEYLERRGPMSPEDAVELLTPIMLSLKKVHRTGLIHRDISPDNIMIVDGQVKLLDFGAARDVSGSANKSLSVMLKPGYAPEEQYRSKGRQGPWTDVYALCATLYKCITGKTPDDAPQRVLEDELEAPSSLGIRIDANTEKAIMKGLSVLQKNRYQTVDDLIEDLKKSGKGFATDGRGSGDPVNGTVCHYPPDKAETDGDRTVYNDSGVEQIAEPLPFVPAGERPEEKSEEGQRTGTESLTAKSDAEMAGSSGDNAVHPEKVRRKGKRKLGFIILSVILIALAVCAVIVSHKAMSTTTIAGEEYSKETDYVSIYSSDLTADDLKALRSLGNLKTLSFRQCTIDNDALKYVCDTVPNLATLVISDCTGISDYSPISNLKFLKQLHIDGCDLTDDQFAEIGFDSIPELSILTLNRNGRLSDLSPMCVCSKLYSLEAEGCGLTSIPTLPGNSLFSLKVNGNKISDISAMVSFNYLGLLEANDNEIADISTLAGIPSLYDVYLDGNRVSDLAPLSNLKSLRILSVNDNAIESLQPLSSCEKLEKLNISRNQLTSFDGLQHALRLESLEAAGNSITSLDGLENCTVLERVILNGNDLEDLSILAKSSKTLTTVFFNDNRVADLSPLSGSVGLKYLSFDRNSVDTLTPLDKSVSLYAISAEGNKLTSLKGIENMTKLTYIFLPHNSISDISALAELAPKAEDNYLAIDLSSNSVEDLDLSSAKEYRYLAVYNNPIQSLKTVSEIRGSYLLFTYVEGEDYSEFKDSFNSFKVIDCPLDKRVEVQENLGKYRTSFRSAAEADQETRDILAKVF